MVDVPFDDGLMVAKRSQVVDELGQVKFEGYEQKFSPVFPKLGFRSLYDNRGLDDREVSTTPSQLDLTQYVDNRDVIAKLTRNLSDKVLLGISERLDEDSDYDGDDVFEKFDESDEPLDNVTTLSNMSETENPVSPGVTEKVSDKEPSEEREKRSDSSDEQGE